MKAFLTFKSGTEAHILPLPRRRFTVGSGTGMDLRVSLTEIPPYAGSFTWDEGRGSAVLETNASARALIRINGQPLATPACLLEDGAIVGLGGFPLRFNLAPDLPTVNGQPMRSIPLTGRNVRIGRGNDEGDPAKIVLDPEDGDASRLHLILERDASGSWEIQDHSQIGSELNGQAFDRERLVVGDRIRAGHYVFEFTGRSLRRLPTSSGAQIIGEKLHRVVGRSGKCILNQASIDVPPGSFVGLLGGSGQGKSTLMTALCGLNPATSGRVTMNGFPLHGGGSQNETRQAPDRIGYVPQDDIVHMELTVRQAITFSALLRLPDTPAPRQVSDLVNSVVARLGLQAHVEKRVRQLSGGQRKRVSIATELLMKPAVLFLDEPSSGLDPATEARLMDFLRQLAGPDCTVICTTHILDNAHLLDRIAFVQAGRIVYYGQPLHAPEFFAQKTLRDVYVALDEARADDAPDNGRCSAAEWERRYDESPFRPAPAPEIPVLHDQGAAPPARPPGFWQNLSTLLRRQWAVLVADPMNVLFLFAQAAAIAILVGWVAESGSLRSFLSVVAVLWFGCSNAAQQIVGEAPIFRRERVCGLGVGVYLSSKLLFTSIVTGLQASLLFLIVVWMGHTLHDGKFERLPLEEDPRLSLEPEVVPEEVPGSGKTRLMNAFDFNEAAATALAGRFRLDSGAPADPPHLDEAAVERTAQKLASEMTQAGLSLKSTEGRDYVDRHLTPANAPPPPPRRQPPGAINRAVMFALIEWFDLEDNVRDSRPRPLYDASGQEIRDPVTNAAAMSASVSLGRVVVLPVVLRLAALLAAAVTGVAIGLAISAAVQSPTQAAMVVPLVLIPQILFGGYVISVPQLTRPARLIARAVPSHAAQRITETASLQGARVPSITNTTKIPAFIHPETEEVTWRDDSGQHTTDYVRRSPRDTAWQNLIVNPAIAGQRPLELDDNREEKLYVKERRDIEPYRKGDRFLSLAPASEAAGILGTWIVLCCAFSATLLRRKRPV